MLTLSLKFDWILIRPLSFPSLRVDPCLSLDLLAPASADLATGDIISMHLQQTGTGAWSLLPTQGIFGSVRPGRLLRGPLPGGPGGVSFPSWFGRNSTQGKNSRLLAELSNHLRLSTHGAASDPRSVNLDYLYPLVQRLTGPLREGEHLLSILSVVLLFLLNHIKRLMMIQRSACARDGSA